jgi:hypothetical protein
VPYGIDRLYLGPDDKGRHRTRNMGDGSQVMLAVDSDTVLASYPPNPKKGSSTHYKRQFDEHIVLVPGAPERVEVVRQMYRRHLVDGWGTHRIALELNDSGARSADGKLWNKLSVQKILDNPTFTGQGIASRYASGIYYTRGPSAAPQSVDRSTQNVAKNKSVKSQLRPESDWRRQEHPHLADYLGPDLVELARQHHAKVLTKEAAKALRPKTRSKPGGDRHVDSPYLLKGLLRSKQGEHLMTGRRTGPKGYEQRYYQVTRGFSAPTTASCLRRIIPAQPLEKAVLQVVRDVLWDVPNLRKLIIDSLEQQEKEATKAMPCDLSLLISEQDEILARLRDAMLLAESTRRLLQKDIAQWQAQLERLEQRIAMASSAHKGQKPDAEKVVRTVVEKFKAMADGMDELPPAAVRKLLASLVGKLYVDLETRAVELELVLPAGMVATAGVLGTNEPLCLVPTSSRIRGNDAQWADGLKLAQITCAGNQTAGGQKACFTCSRLAA